MNSKRLCPGLSVVAHGESLISTAGAVLIGQTARMIGLDRALSKALARWRWVGDPRSGQDRAERNRGPLAGTGGRFRWCGSDGVAADRAGWPPTPTMRWPRSAPPAPPPGTRAWRPRGGAAPRRAGGDRPGRHAGHRALETSSTPRRPGRRPSGSTRCWPSSTTARAGTGEPLAGLLRAG